MKMEELLEKMQPHYEEYLRLFLEEQETNYYKRLRDNPRHKDIKAIIDAMNCIRSNIGLENIKLSDAIKK